MKFTHRENVAVVTPSVITAATKAAGDFASCELPADLTAYTSCQQRFFEEACAGNDVFLAGKPGTGKTHITVNYAKHRLALGDKVIITATTGKAVMNLSSWFEAGELAGVGTLNSVLGLGIDFGDRRKKMRGADDLSWANTLIGSGFANATLACLLKGKTNQRVIFIIDEVSMLDARLLWVVWHILMRHNPRIQLVLVGDGNQLQPVSTKDNKTTPFWQAAVMTGCKAGVENLAEKFKVIELKTNVRQAADPALKDALDHLALTNELSGVLLERVEGCLNGTIKAPVGVEVTHIRANNLTVKRINERMTAAMNTEKRVYRAVISDNTNSPDRIPSWVNEFSPIGAEMTLAVGMPVKLRKNRRQQEGILEASNGSRGIITKLEDRAVWVDFEHGVNLKVEPVTFEGATNSKGESKGSFRQLPLHPDFATTCHSCQGLTIDNPGVIGVYSEVRQFKNGKPVVDAEGYDVTFKKTLNDPEWLLVACSRFTKADLIYFDVADPNALNLLIGSLGNKDLSYMKWLASKQ